MSTAKIDEGIPPDVRRKTSNGSPDWPCLLSDAAVC